MDKLVPPSTPGGVAKQKAATLPYTAQPNVSSRRSRGIVGFLKKLSPRLKRTPSPEPDWEQHREVRASRGSVASDHSFEIAMHNRYSRLERQGATDEGTPEAARNKEGRTKSGGLSGFLNSLRPSRSSSRDKHEKNLHNSLKQASKQQQSKTDKKEDQEANDVKADKNQRNAAEAARGVRTPPSVHQNGHTPRVTTPNKVPGIAPLSIPVTTVPSFITAMPSTTQVQSRLVCSGHCTATPLTPTRVVAGSPTTPIKSHACSTNVSVGNAERPHTLYIPPAPSVELSGSWGVVQTSPQSPMPVPLLPSVQAPSVDSIGTCSLDVNATGTLSPATMEALDGSRRSLRSISLDNHLSCGNSPPVTPVRPILKPVPLTDPGGVPDAVRSYKPPSYLGISCAVSGYSNINRYDSVLREGFRSRDASPARLAFSRSRDSSPMRPEWRVYDPLGQRTSPQATAAKIKELKEQLAKCARELPTFERQGRQGSTRRRDERSFQVRSVSVDRGYLTKASEMNGNATMSSVHNGGPRVHLVEIDMNDSNSRKSNNYEYSFERRIIRDGKFEAKESMNYSSNNKSDVIDSPNTKSFIQSRIERLYGPSALAAGFHCRRSTLEKERQNSPKPVIPTHDTQKENGGEVWDPETPPEGMPSVFRHLRPEFRTQLPVRRLGRRNSRDSPIKEGRQIPIQIESTPPSTPEVDIPLVPLPQDIINRSSNINNNNIIDIQKMKLLNGENGCVDVRDSKINNIPAKQNGNACMKDNAVHPVNENGDSSEVVSSNLRTISVNSVNGVSETSHLNGDTVDDQPIKDSKKTPDSFTSKKVVKDGHYFLKVVAEEVARIEIEVAKIETDFEPNNEKVTEEVRGKVLAGIGKAKLLISQKIKQFCGLCHKNIAADPSEEFPTTLDDLAGFWDMVYIQVEDIWANIKAIHTLRDNNWVEVKVVSDKTDSARTTQRKSSRPKKVSTEKSEEIKARDEARKKMMEERRRAMKEAMKAKKAQVEAQKTENTDAVEMFVPES